MVDALTLAALGLSAVTLVAVIVLILSIRTKPSGTVSDPGGLATTLGEVKGSVSNLHAAVSQLSSMVGEIRQATNDTSSGMVEMRKFAELMTGSSQKRGAAGEVVVSSYLERLPREMWEKQFYLPGSSDRVDYALRINDGGKTLYLPIDAKFSLPGDAEEFVDEANRLAMKRAEEVGKYVTPGVTVDFAVMVLPNSVYYALTAETTGALQGIRVVACPPEGVIVLSSLAMRAHQAFVLAQGTDHLRSYVQIIGERLDAVSGEMAKLVKHLKGASRYAEQTLGDIEGTKSALGEIMNRLGNDTSEGLMPEMPTSPPSLELREEDAGGETQTADSLP